MLKKRFPRFLVLLLICGALLGGVYLLEMIGLTAKIFPNLKDYPGFELWMPLLPPLALCVLGQLFGDILNLKWMDNQFFLFIKRVLFLGFAILSMFWYAYSFETDYSIQITDLESAYMSMGFLGTLFIYLAYVFAYVFWSKRKLYPFFPIFSIGSAILVDYLLCLFWPDGGFWVFIAVVAVIVIVFFARPDDRLFERYSDSNAHDSKKIAEDLAYLDDPHLRPGLARDYDENGYYFGACCDNCAFCRRTHDKHGFIVLYCALSKQEVQGHESCDAHKRAK